jgi:flagellar protein FlaG
MEISSVQPNISSRADSSGAAAAQNVVERRDLARATRALNDSQILGANNELVFVLDRATHRTLTRLVDRTTREVVMQLPAEYVLRIAEDLNKRE